MKYRILKVIKIYFLLIVLLIGYFFINKYTGFYIPCIFRLITGYKCPGCGITTCLFDLLQLKIDKAFHDNQLVFIYLPFIAVYFLYLTYLYIYDKEDKILKKIPNWIIYIVLGITIIYGVIRNF